MRHNLSARSPFSLATRVDLGKRLLFRACSIPSIHIHKLYSATFSPVGPHRCSSLLLMCSPSSSETQSRRLQQKCSSVLLFFSSLPRPLLLSLLFFLFCTAHPPLTGVDSLGALPWCVPLCVLCLRREMTCGGRY